MLPKGLPPQVVRLVLVAAGTVAIYLVANFLLTPKSFGAYGFYRGDALTERTQLPVHYGGKESCYDCHKEATKSLLENAHKGQSCEGCHGLGMPHIEHSKDTNFNPAKVGKDVLCLRCHRKDPARPKKFKQIGDIDEHTEGGKACVSCHLPHNPEEEPE